MKPSIEERRARARRLMDTSPVQRVGEGAVKVLDMLIKRRQDKKRAAGGAPFKFNKAVDSGPLPQEADTGTRQTIQDERIRRQVQSHVYPGAKKKGGY